MLGYPTTTERKRELAALQQRYLKLRFTIELKCSNEIDHPVQKEVARVNVLTAPHPFFVIHFNLFQLPHMISGLPKPYKGYITFYNPLSRLHHTSDFG